MSAHDGLIRLDGVGRTYTSSAVPVEALKATSLEIEAGAFMAIMGPSGSGKSTLLHILGCLDRPSFGTYHIDGRDVSSLTDYELARVRNQMIGFVFQRFNLLRDERAIRNVELPLLYGGLARRERRQRATEALERVGLGARVRHYPGELSGGEQQRVALARALVKRPKLLLADEPTGNLDSVSGKHVLEMVEGESERGTTVILITHDASIAAHAQRRLEILDGVVTESA